MKSLFENLEKLSLEKTKAYGAYQGVAAQVAEHLYDYFWEDFFQDHQVDLVHIWICENLRNRNERNTHFKIRITATHRTTKELKSEKDKEQLKKFLQEKRSSFGADGEAAGYWSSSNQIKCFKLEKYLEVSEWYLSFEEYLSGKNLDVEHIPKKQITNP